LKGKWDTDEHGYTQINHFSRQAAKLATNGVNGMFPFLKHLIPEKGTFASAAGRGKTSHARQRAQSHRQVMAKIEKAIEP